MRVISGTCRGKTLKTIKGLNTRPTAAKIKAAVFNVLDYRVEDALVLDLFGGTGNMGIEALSRGASSVLYSEKDSSAYKILRKNLEDCGFSDKAFVVKGDYRKALLFAKKKKFKFNIVYLDPPYDFLGIKDIISYLFEEDLLANKAVLVVETSKRKDFKDGYKDLVKVREKTYGDTKIVYFQLLLKEDA